MIASAVVDLFAFRCAVAALVHARHNIDRLSRDHVHRVNDAVHHLTGQLPELAGDIARHTAAVLSPDPDPNGRRTVHAIDALAELTHVDADTAPVLAATLKPAIRPVTLFDLDAEGA